MNNYNQQQAELNLQQKQEQLKEFSSHIQSTEKQNQYSQLYEKIQSNIAQQNQKELKFKQQSKHLSSQIKNQSIIKSPQQLIEKSLIQSISPISPPLQEQNLAQKGKCNGKKILEFQEWQQLFYLINNAIEENRILFEQNVEEVLDVLLTRNKNVHQLCCFCEKAKGNLDHELNNLKYKAKHHIMIQTLELTQKQVKCLYEESAKFIKNKCKKY